MCPLLPGFVRSGLYKELVFVPVASALTSTHRDCLIIASFS